MHKEFIDAVWDYYRKNGRQMPWREEPTFYHVLVSELMLQQTQVERVRVKYDEFMKLFPYIESLANAPLSDVLKAWQGLGYNRRAKFLHEAAKNVHTNGVPVTFNHMVKLPGVGKNTAGALMNYAYNSPTPFVETNIRTVFFHHFFADSKDISDADIVELVAETMDRENPREWFWALMDYGTFLKKQGLGRLDVSRHYKKQSPLAGSVREVRGSIIRQLASGAQGYDELRTHNPSDNRFVLAYEGLIRDGLIAEAGGAVRLTD